MRKRTYFWEKGGSSGRRKFEKLNLSTVLRHLHFAITVLREGDKENMIYQLKNKRDIVIYNYIVIDFISVREV